MSAKSDSLTLFDIERELSDAYRHLEDLRETDASVEEIVTALSVFQAYAMGEKSKVDSIGGFFQHLDNNLHDYDKELVRLKAKKEKAEKQTESLKKYVLNVMKDNGLKEIRGKLWTFKVKNNPPKVVITDELAIPPEFLVIPDPPPPNISKTLIKKALERQEEVPGAELIQEDRLEIS